MPARKARRNPSQMRPASRKLAPDPSDAYERSHPEHESGMGRLDNNDDATPTTRPDKIEQTVHHRQDSQRQLNAGDAINQRGGAVAEEPPNREQYKRRRKQG